MSSTKRAWKLQEFVAHGGNVNCVALGHKSGRVMVTGGEDKKVNMWAVGKPNCVMSLSGHTSPIEAVRFGMAEEMVVAGSLSGALKIWDLEAAKILRTLTGHKSSIQCLDFHPYGDFVASGSLDTNVKLWDIRRKGCIMTYKGHLNCVNSLRFSPDGRWLASVGEDGLLKLWDLQAGKLLVDFKNHRGPVNAVEFHPDEFLLATGSSDRTVKFWDLEKLELVSSTDGDSTPIRNLMFHPEGLCLYCGAQDYLKVYGWEPADCYDSIPLNWGKVADITIGHNQLIGATFSQNNVSTFVVDIQRVQPIGGSKPPMRHPTSPPMPSSGRRSFILGDRPHTQSSTSQRADGPKEEPEEAVSPTEDPGDDATSTADITDPEDYNKIFKPNRQLGKAVNSTVTMPHSPTRMVEPFPAPPDDVYIPPPQTAQPLPPAPEIKVNKPAPKTASSQPSSSAQSSREPPPSAPSSRPPPSVAVSVPKPKNNVISAEDFLPKEPCLPSVGGSSSANISETEAISSIAKGHSSMVAVLSSRNKNLQIVRALWTGGNTRTAVDSAVSMNDQAILVDLLGVLTQKHSLWSLDVCASLLPKLKDLFESKYDNYVEIGGAGLRVILKNFAPVIKSNISAVPSIGVDISREERYRKCKMCYSMLMDLRQTVEQKHKYKHNDKLSGMFRELQLLMGQLD